MSAVNVAVSANGKTAWIVTDSAAYNTRTGVLAYLAPKVKTVPHMSAAIAGRGNLSALEIAWRVLSPLHSFDALAERCQPLLTRAFAIPARRRVRAIGARLMLRPVPQYGTGIAAPGAIEITAVGWSTKTESFQALSTMSESLVPFEPALNRGFLGPPLAANNLAWLHIPDSRVDSLNPRAWPDMLLHALHMQRESMLAKRRADIDAGRAPFGECIGGPIVLTTITRAGITQQIIHTFPDKVGQIIGEAPPPQGETTS